jgi:uncharacterized membrane protein (UPF0127 family)
VRTIVAILLLLALASGCRDSRPPADGPGTKGRRSLYLVPVGPGVTTPAEAEDLPIAFVEVATEPAARQFGLMEREGLAEDHGMLFIYPREEPRSFWMKNTRIPLTIAFATSTGRIVRILDMEPGIGVGEGDLPRYESGVPATFALEMDRGWFAKQGIGVGDRLLLHPEISAREIR